MDNWGFRLVEMWFRQLQSQPNFLLKVYKTYILPPIMYASLLWSLLTCDMMIISYKECNLGSPNELWGVVTKVIVTGVSVVTYSQSEREMLTVFKLIHGLHGVTLEDAGLSLCISITPGSWLRLEQGHVINNAICNIFKYRAPQQWNSLPLNIVQYTNLQVSNVNCLFICRRTIQRFLKFLTYFFIHLVLCILFV